MAERPHHDWSPEGPGRLDRCTRCGCWRRTRPGGATDGAVYGPLSGPWSEVRPPCVRQVGLECRSCGKAFDAAADVTTACPWCGGLDVVEQRAERLRQIERAWLLLRKEARRRHDAARALRAGTSVALWSRSALAWEIASRGAAIYIEALDAARANDLQALAIQADDLWQELRRESALLGGTWALDQERTAKRLARKLTLHELQRLRDRWEEHDAAGGAP